MAIVNTNTSPLLSEGTSITLSQSGQIITVNAVVAGVQDIYIPATDMYLTTTNPANAIATTEVATSLVNFRSIDFSNTVTDNAQFSYVFPRNWNLGTINIKFYWTAASGTGGVVWAIKAGAYGDDDVLTTALGTEVTVTDTFIAANEMHITSYTPNLTIAGTISDGDMVFFNITRLYADASDTLNAFAKLIGVSIKYTTDSATAE